ncbi:hypothetical protein LG634_26950 [Streptomyces bambusae]|uniref:hypothetical protein n=1 Tax=Streptomyces bambusae TaxID=1550616 RepID=UPI001CFDFC17|nr:hypothetical protein [Streptomyces bambusae]MCB5168448.1 hypothetical protein [Streptomyces bambusae]
MPGHHRYHLDQDGHSITVLHDARRHRAEVWVDGKTVAATPTAAHDATVLHAELPTDPPRQLTVRIAHPAAPDDAPLCVLETGTDRYLMPAAALTNEERAAPDRTPPARTPGELLARWRARHRT